MKTTVLQKHRKDGRVYLRDSMTLAFFVPSPLHHAADAFRDAVQLYLQTIPPDALTWSAIGENSEEWNRVGKSTFSRCLAQLAPARAKARPQTYFELTDGSLGAEAPGYGLLVVGSRSDDPILPDEVNLIQMCFPFEVIERDTVEDFVAFCRRVAGLVPFVSGYASPGLQWALLHRGEAMAEARSLAIRHPGYDVAYNFGARLRLGHRTRGARWLTFLNSDLVSTVGGADHLRQSLSQAITLESAGTGLMIRAGEMPELGDVNNGANLPLLREVAAALEPITAFRELALLGNFAERDESFFERWERRFLE